MSAHLKRLQVLKKPGGRRTVWKEEKAKTKAPFLGDECSGYPKAEGRAEESIKLRYRVKDLKDKYEGNKCASEVVVLLKPL